MVRTIITLGKALGWGVEARVGGRREKIDLSNRELDRRYVCRVNCKEGIGHMTYVI